LIAQSKTAINCLTTNPKHEIYVEILENQRLIINPIRHDKNPSEYTLMQNLTDDTSSQVQREEIDPVFKQVLIFRCEQLNISLQTQFEVSRIARTMDALIRFHTSQEIEQAQEQTPLVYLREHNQIEYKGKRDPLTIAGYHLIRGRTHLYLGEKDISAMQMTVTIVCSNKPRKVLYHCKDDVTFKKLEDGYYVSSDKPPVYIIVINELAIIPRNYPLLVFASSEKVFRQFLRQTFKEENFQYIRYAYAVQPKVTKEELAMAGRHHRLSREDLEFIAQDIGSELVTFFSIEERLKGLDLEERLHGLSLEERLKGLNSEERLHGLSLEERLRGLDANELRELKQTIENLENSQKHEEDK